MSNANLDVNKKVGLTSIKKYWISSNKIRLAI